MSDCKRILAGRRARLTAALVSLILSAAIGGALAAWPTLARQRVQEQATLAAAETTLAVPISPPADSEPDAATIAEHAAGSPSGASATSVQTTRHPAFTVSWERTETSHGGQTRLLRVTTRYQRADGLYKLVQTYPAQESQPGRVETYFGYVGLGLFRLDEARQRLVFTAPQIDDRLADVEASLRADPRFDREEEVHGQRTLVMRIDEGDAAAYTEEYHAPALGGLLFKRVEHTPRGREAWQPTSIEFGEPAPSLFAALNRYKPDYAHYEREIQKTERDPQQRAAAQIMRELLGRMRTAKPDGR